MPIMEVMPAAVAGAAPRSRNMGTKCTINPPIPNAIVTESADMDQKAAVLRAACIVNPAMATVAVPFAASLRSVALNPR